MTLERYIRLIAGTFVLASLASGDLGQPVLVLVHGLRARKSVSVRAHQVVPHGRHLEGAGGEVKVRPELVIGDLKIWRERNGSWRKQKAIA